MKKVKKLTVSLVLASCLLMLAAGCDGLFDFGQDGGEKDKNDGVSVTTWQGLEIIDGASGLRYTEFQGKEDVLKLSPTETGAYPWAPLRYDLTEYRGKSVTLEVSMNVWLDEPAVVVWQAQATNDERDAYPLIAGNWAINNKTGQWMEISGATVLTVKDMVSPLLYLKEDVQGLNAIYIAGFRATVTPIAVTGVSLDIETLDMTAGSGETLTAAVQPPNATNKNVIWISSAPGVAAVDDSGRVTAVSAGTATITVTTVDGGKTAQATVTVTAPETAVTGVSLNKNALSLLVGGSETLTATVQPDNATAKTVAWSSDKTNVAAVDDSGNVTAVSPGSAIIKVTTAEGGWTAQAAVTVTAPETAVTGVSLNKNAFSLLVGGSETLTATVQPNNATNKTVSWSSSNSGVAAVDNSGRVTGKSAGTATITVTTTDGGKTAEATVTVTANDNGADYWTSSAYTDTVLGAARSYQGNSIMVINYAEDRQIIDGFGGSDAWKSDVNSGYFTQVLNDLYSTNGGGIGLTILRNRIPFTNGDNFVQANSGNYRYSEDSRGVKTFDLNWNTWDLSATKTLISKIKTLSGGPGADFKVISTPWSPPNNSVAQWKTNGNNSYVGGSANTANDYSKSEIGGMLKSERYADYADLLADYALNFESRMGWPLTLLSIQNEPTTKPDYESCVWTAEQIRDFIKVLGDRFKLKNVQPGLGIIAPEDENLKEDMIVSSLNDAKAESILTHVGVHQYEASWDSSRLGAEKLTKTSAEGKRIWQTEMGQTNAGKGSGFFPKTNDIDNALVYARMIHYDLTITEVNAWIYWWLWSHNNPESDALIYIDSGNNVSRAKRYYAVGHFSKFVRPGWQRIGSSTQPGANVLTSAYKKPGSSEIALVLINHGSGEAKIRLELQGAAQFKTFSGAWRTSAAENFASVAAPAAENAAADYTLPANSITTVLGTVE
jgi:uncharacterized protein YjdB